jgi:hypothetical protein
MLFIRGDIMQLRNDYDGFCITTNGFVKSNGECVMGRGIALTCRNMFPNLASHLGSLILTKGNHVHLLGTDNVSYIISFPVKHNWWESADIELIKRSCNELMTICDKHNFHRILLPRPGCGNGHLNWSDVEPIITPLLDDRIYVATF